MCTMRSRDWGGVFEPIEPPVEKPETPTTPPSTKDLITIKIEDDIMAVVGTNTTSWKAISHGNGRYVAVGYKLDLNNLFGPNVGYIATSPDCETWTIISYDGFNLRAIAYGISKFVAVGGDGYAFVSADNGEWVQSSIIMHSDGSSTSKDTLKAVAYGSYLFVAIGYGIHYSYDGKSWSAGVNSNPGNIYEKSWEAVAYGNNKFVVIGSDGYVSTSSDGRQWNTLQQGYTNLPNNAIAYGNGKFVAVGDDGYVSVSTDGTTWTAPKQIGTYAWHNVIYTNDRFIAVSGTHVTTSIDGITWTSPTEIKDAAGNNLTGIFAIMAIP